MEWLCDYSCMDDKVLLRGWHKIHCTLYLVQCTCTHVHTNIGISWRISKYCFHTRHMSTAMHARDSVTLEIITHLCTHLQPNSRLLSMALASCGCSGRWTMSLPRGVSCMWSLFPTAPRRWSCSRALTRDSWGGWSMNSKLRMSEMFKANS